jgi:hypothetical protein
MEKILNKLVDSRILTILETININYPNKFLKTEINNELNYIKEHIHWKKQIHNKKKKIKVKQKPKLKLKLKNKINIDTTSITIKNNEIDVKKCSGRIWSDDIKNSKTMVKINEIDNKFKVDDFIDIDIKEFNSKYIIGSRCSKNQISNSKYCKLHSNHLIHGDYLESPSKELCYHFMKDGKYL